MRNERISCNDRYLTKFYTEKQSRPLIEDSPVNCMHERLYSNLNILKLLLYQIHALIQIAKQQIPSASLPYVCKYRPSALTQQDFPALRLYHL